MAHIFFILSNENQSDIEVKGTHKKLRALLSAGRGGDDGQRAGLRFRLGLTSRHNVSRSHTPTTVFLSVMAMKPMIHALLSEVVKGAPAHTV